MEGRAGGSVVLVVDVSAVGATDPGAEWCGCVLPPGVADAMPHAANIPVSSRRNDRRVNTPEICSGSGVVWERGYSAVLALSVSTPSLALLSIRQCAWMRVE